MPPSKEHWRKIQDIFHETHPLSEPARTSILLERRGGDTTLMAELRALLAACNAEQTRRFGRSS